MGKYDDLMEAAYHCNMKIYNLGLARFTFGNASAADREKGVFAIKPSGVPFDELSPGNMVVVDFTGETAEGTLKPSSDTRTHAVLYSRWEVLGGVVHTHSTYATAWAQTQEDIPVYGTTHADYLHGDVPCTRPMSEDRIAGDYEHGTGVQIVEEFDHRNIDYRETGMVLVGNHAPFTWGGSGEEAVFNSAMLEEIAKLAFLSRQIRPDTPRMQQPLIQKHYQRKHGKDSYYGQE